MTERFERFSLAISELYYYLHKITRDEMEEYGLSGPHAIYLFVLSRNEKGFTSAELSDATFKNKADVSRAVTLLEKKGLVTRNGGAKNSYRAKITLTADGVAAAKKLKDRAKVVTDKIGKDLTEENREILYKGLESIALNMRNLCDLKD